MADRENLLDLKTERLIAVREDVGEGWPFGIASDTGAVVTADAPDWRGGYWIEILRLLGERTGDWGYYLEGASRLGTLRGLLAHRNTLNGPAFYYGAARLYATLSDRNSRTAALAAAYGIRTLADPETGMLPLGEGDDSGAGNHSGKSGNNGKGCDDRHRPRAAARLVGARGDRRFDLPRKAPSVFSIT